jgi:hypothetical protein
MGSLHFHRITRVVAVKRKGGDEDRAVPPTLSIALPISSPVT